MQPIFLCRQQEHDLGLDWIRVLELIDKQIPILPLKRAAHGGVLAQDLRGQDQQVTIVERVEPTPFCGGVLSRPGEQRDGQAIYVLAPGAQVRGNGRLAELRVERLDQRS